ncbi:TPA: hypothetical protein LA460_000220 [Clostridium botulinum]|nr:hypothetical protein [Clostridium botulinum]HBJ1652824.1 hypothetical protein [Clostridium botulinum]
MFKKSIKFGKYKIYENINKIKMDKFLKLIQENTEIRNCGNGEVKFILNNVNNLILYEIDNFTNLRKFKNIPNNLQEILKLEDENLNSIINTLQVILNNLLEVNKNIIIDKVDTLGKKMREIKEKKESFK